MSFQHDKLYLKVKDHSVSGETFELFLDENLDMLVTAPKPSTEKLPEYYDSDDYISHTDGKRSIFEVAYQFIKGYALKRKLSLINGLNAKGSLLDIGAGTGDFLVSAKRNGWHVTGSEPSEKARSIASKKGIDLLSQTSGLPSNSFDIITMWHVLEHVYDLEIQIAELKRLLKPEGTIIIAVPNFKSYDAQYYAEFWAAYDVPRHLWHFSRTAIQKLFERQDIQLRQTLPMIFDAYYVSLLSEKYKTGRMDYINALRIGWTSNAKARQSKEYSSHIYVLSNRK